MNLHDDHLPPAWLERGNHYHWEDLTENELLWLELDERPSRHPSSWAVARRVPAGPGTPGVDTSVAPSSMAPGGNRLPVAGPTPDGAC